MKMIQVYDKPMCCSTGVCGPQVDPVLPRFAADLDWLKAQGHHVERFNLAQQPQAFIDNPAVHQILSTEGTESLPLIIVDGQIVSRAAFPSREKLSQWADSASQPIPSDGCCSDTRSVSKSGCCSDAAPSGLLNILNCDSHDSKCC